MFILFDPCLGKVEYVIRIDLEHYCVAHGPEFLYPDSYFYSTGLSQNTTGAGDQ